MHKNKLSSLPTTFADLTALTVLDLSYNGLTSVPEKLFALPELTTLNLSHNSLTSLPFNAPFAGKTGRSKANQPTGGNFFTPVVLHATTPLPRLVHLDASFNKIISTAIDNTIPVSLIKLDLSGNPLGVSIELLRHVSSLKKLKEIKFERAEIGDDSFPKTLFSSTPFPALRLLDLSETQANLDSVQEALKEMTQELNFDFSTEDPPQGVARILVGKRVVKEPWELELERREKARVAATSSFADDWTIAAPEPRAASRTSNVTPTPAQPKVVEKLKVVIKEAWEIEAEQGLLTEGGRRRARAAAAVAQAQPTSGPSPPPSTSPVTTQGLSNSQYFTENTQTLRLPTSSPPTKAARHARAFSMAAPSISFPSSPTSNRSGDLSVPTPTLPLSTIVAQPFASTLRVLILANRRMDRSFALPSGSISTSGFLPCLEELDLEACNLSDLVPISRADSDNTSRTSEPIITTLAKLFPSLQTLNLSYNALSNSSLTPEALGMIILRSPHRKGLRHLRLRGNRISDLDGFLGLAEAFKGNRDVVDWMLEELDVRDNEIGKLPPELGLLPLDVFLVDGNM